MRWFKKEPPVSVAQVATELRLKDYVECKKCGHVVSKDSVKLVTKSTRVINPDFMFRTHHEDMPYCNNCAPPYDRFEWLGGGYRYYAWSEVDENGKPISKAKLVKVEK